MLATTRMTVAFTPVALSMTGMVMVIVEVVCTSEQAIAMGEKVLTMARMVTMVTKVIITTGVVMQVIKSMITFRGLVITLRVNLEVGRLIRMTERKVSSRMMVLVSLKIMAEIVNGIKNM
jgi:hypothetical protein